MKSRWRLTLSVQSNMISRPTAQKKPVPIPSFPAAVQMDSLFPFSGVMRAGKGEARKTKVGRLPWKVSKIIESESTGVFFLMTQGVRNQCTGVKGHKGQTHPAHGGPDLGCTPTPASSSPKDWPVHANDPRRKGPRIRGFPGNQFQSLRF